MYDDHDDDNEKQETLRNLQAADSLSFPPPSPFPEEKSKKKTLVVLGFRWPVMDCSIFPKKIYGTTDPYGS